MDRINQLRITNYELRGLKISAFICVHLWLIFSFSAFAHEGEDHSGDKKTTATNAAAIISIVTAERNIQNESGQFNLILKRSPGDPRTGETGQFLVRIAEKVEGGFGANEPVPFGKATVRASITKTDGTPIAENLPAAGEENGNYRVSYTFGNAGDYKIVFAVTTADNRSFSADFPVAVASAPIRRSFWIGMAILSLLTLGSLGAVFYTARRRGEGRVNYKRIAPFAVAALLLFAFGTFALAYFLPPRETRAIAEIPANATTETAANALPATNAALTIPKESQILFGIKTAPVSTRQITSGLKTTGVVR
ncbi:MAG: hypothetical protein M3Q33_08410, partial [Acidobacteriota bacterium]|nr:hypothetical protein [Acidobacteriota bacterium]